MSENQSKELLLFEDKRIRYAWDSEAEKHWLSIVDVVAVLNDSDYQTARNYWKWLKNKLSSEKNELVSFTNQLRMQTPDGKMRMSDVADIEQILGIIQSIQSRKKEAFVTWLNQLKNGLEIDLMGSEIVIYQTDDGLTKIDVYLEDETVWLTQIQMAELFQTTRQNISLHINNAISEKEFEQDSVIKESLTTALDGKNYQTKYYNLDVIISVGYRVKSLRGVQFRRWATSVLREYLIKGFAMNDTLLKQAGGGNYWRELLERIRDIRSSEKMLYRQVLELYATSMDYDKNSKESRHFFQVVQNKMHYATHGHTASEVIYNRANAELVNMGLTHIEGDRPKKSEIVVAKNYLTEDELAWLNNMVSAFFELAELRARNREPMYMKDWIQELDFFAERYGKGVLTTGGTISTIEAQKKAEAEYDKYKKRIKNEPSQVELDYFEHLKKTQKLLENKTKK